MTRRGRIIPFPGRRGPAVEKRSLVEVRRCSQAEATVIRSFFESEGIPTVCRSRISHSVHPFTVGSQGEVVILVPAEDAPTSRRLLLRLVRRR